MSGKVVAVGLVAIAACAVGSYFYFTKSDVVVAGEGDSLGEPVTVASNDFFSNVISDPMSAIGLKEPFGIRNNNPLNIRYDEKTKWNGQTGSNQGFCTFATPFDGLRAGARNLDTYGKRGLNTIEKIIQSWAPKNENNVEAYIKSVCSNSGFSRSQILYRSRGDFLPLMKAMIKHENGKQPYSDSEIIAGINAA